MKTSAIHPAFDHSALFAKSQLFISRGYRALTLKDFEEYQLWASLALELLAKSTLSHFSPALVADPTSSESLFAACGLARTTDVKSIAAHTLFSRLSKLSKSFDTHVARFCKELSARRNSELHSGESPFSGMKLAHWEEQFWYAVNALLVMQDKDLSDWLSEDDARSKSQMLHDADTAREKAVSARIKNREQDLREKHKDPAELKKLIESSHTVSPWSYAKRLGPEIDAVESRPCPSCSATGVVGGVFWEEEVIDQSEFDAYDMMPEETVSTVYVVEKFWCPVCQLELTGTREVSAGHLDPEFTRIETREVEFEPDYGND